MAIVAGGLGLIAGLVGVDTESPKACHCFDVSSDFVAVLLTLYAVELDYGHELHALA